MSDKKNTRLHDKERLMNSEVAHILSKERSAIDKSEKMFYTIEDKRKVVREEHIGGSRPKSTL